MANNQAMASADLDIESLASQAIKLFRKRLAKLYDTHLEHLDVDKKGYVTYEEYEKWHIKTLSPTHTEEKAKEVCNMSWSQMTGGYSPYQVSRQQSIDLSMKGYHGKDKALQEKLREEGTTILTFHFELMDTDKDGVISRDEWYRWAADIGDLDHWKGAFELLDLNNDDKISIDEWLQCILGFRFSLNQDRYNHFFGPLSNDDV